MLKLVIFCSMRSQKSLYLGFSMLISLFTNLSQYKITKYPLELVVLSLLTKSEDG